MTHPGEQVQGPEGSPPPAREMTARPPGERRRLVSRRAFTAGLGASLLAAPFLELLHPRRAWAADKTAKRLVVVFNPNGTVPARWRPSGTETSFTFPSGSILEPLTPHQGKLVIVDGLKFTNASNHEGGMVAMLTGNGRAQDESKGMSVDQFVAQAIGGSTRLRSLELGVQTSAWGAGAQTRMAYAAPSVFASPDDDPRSVFSRVFGGGSGTPSGADLAAKRRKSVLDAVQADLRDLRARVGAEERLKLDQHLSSIRELEKTLGLDGGGTTSCTGGTPPAAIDHQANPNMPTVGKSQMDLLVAALACGATRVASLQWAFTVAPHVLSWLSLSDSHHGLSHNGDGDAVGVGNFVKAERWFAEQFAYLLGKLATTPDPAGGTLLDSTLVVWAKEMGDARLHVCTEVPMVLAGGGGAFATGRYLKTSGASHVHLLVSVCQAMGLTNTTFGNPAFGSGPLAGL